MEQINWTEWCIVGGAFVPLLTLPLALIGQYIKSLHEQQIRRADDLRDRLQQLAAEVHSVSTLVHEFEKNYTSKDEWLRECARGHAQLDKLTDMVVKMQLELKNGNGAAQKLLEALKHKPGK